jgi:hypothetical protein
MSHFHNHNYFPFHNFCMSISDEPFPIYRPGRLCGDRLCGGHPLVTSCFTPFTDIFGTRDAVAGPHGCVGPFDGGRVVFA